MSGRFFAMPFLVAAMTLVPEIDDVGRALGGAARSCSTTCSSRSSRSRRRRRYDGAWPWRTQNGIKDERGHTHQVQQHVVLRAVPTRCPTRRSAAKGLSFGASDQKAAVYCCIGLYGLNAGPTKHIIDDNALSDPLLARLPVSPRVYFEFWAEPLFPRHSRGLPRVERAATRTC